MIGSFGDIVFEVSDNKIRTFDNFSRGNQGRWEEHEIINKKPRSEFIGPGVDKINFTMRFDVQYGMNPRFEMESLLIISRAGEPKTLIIGGMALGVNKWYISSLKQRWKTVDNRGNVINSELDVTMKEYV